jgi:pilus assembly protein FimV
MSALRCRSIRAWVLAGLLVSISVVSHAAGLGKLTVLSTLGEPLNAEVDLVAEKTELGSLGAHLGTPDAFERAGLSYSSALRGANVSIEKRASGEPYVKITSTKPATEPFVDLLVELTWSTGRISREFTALLDPPDIATERAKQQKAAAAAEVKPAPAPEPPKAEPVPAPPASEPEAPKEAPKADLRIPAEPAEATSAEAPTEQMPNPEATATAPAEPAPAAPVDSGKSSPSADAYGPVKHGDTLNKIATANKPADVSLEQMLVLLARNNPQAFSGKNMNRLKTGKILQLPTADQYATISEADARKEVRLQARDWRAYREQLATAAGNAEPAEQAAQQSSSGKVGAPVQDKAATSAGQPQEVLKLSKNEPAAGGADAKAGARVHALEEEVVARDKAVKEANDRVAKLQKQVTDLQTLLEMKNKSMADLQKPAATPSAPKPVPAPSTPATAVTPATPTPEMKPTTPPPATPAPVAPKSEAAPPPTPPAPTTPKPVPVKQPSSMPSAPEPSLMDQVLDQPVYLGAALGVVLIIIILGVRAVKRRRESHSDSEDAGPARAFANTGDAPVAPLAAVASAPGAEGGSDQVDPVAEAEIFLAYGRDAQAEELLKDALQTSPHRHDVPLKLLQIYANRKDAKSFEKVARDLQQATGGAGPVWDQAVALGYQVDPGNSRYAAGRIAGAAVLAAAASTAAAENVDFNIGGGSDDSTATTTDIDLGDTGNAFERTQIIDPAAEPAHDSTVSIDAASMPSTMDFDVGHAVAETTETPTEDSAKGLDFDIDLNSLSMGPASDETVIEPPGSLDFDMGNLTLDTPSDQETQGITSVPEIDLSGISLDLGTQTSPTASPTGKDDRWYDVQTKFDLAKAYQEMGDKDGAREILKEVLAEGDTEQKAAAESVLARLDS